MLEQSVHEEKRLRQAIREREAELQRLRTLQSSSSSYPANPISHSSLSTPTHSEATPLLSQPGTTFPSIFDSNVNLPPDFTSEPMRRHEVQSLNAIYQQQQDRHEEVFLRPQTNCSTSQGKPLRVIDFVLRLVPHEEERVISSDNQAKLTLTLGRKRPKLESITMADYNIANVRIFYELLCSNRLPTPSDIRDYLSYSVKILELSKKYTWTSVLKYDDEFRVLQHAYGYPWDRDDSHLHEIVLLPKWAANPHSQGSGVYSSGSTHTAPLTFPQDDLGREICRNFNKLKGCTKADCKFSHVCNRKIGNKACSKTHS